jgi:hypothetical protein
VDESLAFQLQGALAVVFSDLQCFDASFLSLIVYWRVASMAEG